MAEVVPLNLPVNDGENDNRGDALREWFSLAELAELRLPGLPADKRGIGRRAREERWTLRTADGTPLSRPRVGRGGGTEFHLSLLPGVARVELARRGIGPQAGQPVEVERAGLDMWRWFDGQSAKTKAEAARRLAVLDNLALLESAGMTRSAALSEVAGQHGVGRSTLWKWIEMTAGTPRADWLPALAPRRTGGGVEMEIDAFIWNLFKSDYLRPSCPTLTSVYYRCQAVAQERGIALPSEKTFRRKLAREVDPRVILLRRKGDEAVRRSLPAQRRTVEQLHALELVNIDGHKFDVFVKTEDGRVIRPIMVAIQDIYSSKFLAWRIDETESAVLTRLAFADLFRNYGIPKGCVFDNGRAFASKWITGGAKSRFRFKIKAEEPLGVLTALGIEIKWALPFRGQSKPIERAFRDLCDSIAKHPAFEGAYTGNNPLAKPDNYGSRAIPMADFVAQVAKGMAAHNARLGRRGRNYNGRSFDAVFAESYATAPIGKTATPEQLRMVLLTAEQQRVDKRTGEVKLAGNRYWSDGCGQLHGQLVTVRFDPDNLHSEIYLYDNAGAYLTTAELIADTGFADTAAAKATAKKVADYRRRMRDAAEAEQLLAAEEVARLQAAVETPEVPEPTVLRPVRHRGQTAAALKVAPAQAGPVKVRPQKGQERPQKEEESRVFAALAKLRVVE